MMWWENRKHLLVREKEKVNEAFPGNDFSFEIRENILWLTGTILTSFEFECRYPQSYPTAIPDIFPKDRSSKWVPKHQYKKEGRFCLDIREKTWCSRLTAADIIKSLETLLVAERIRVDEKKDKLIVYEEPEPNALDHIIKRRLLVIPSDIPLPIAGLSGEFKFIYNIYPNEHRIIMTDITSNGNIQESILSKKVWVDNIHTSKSKGLWIRFDATSFLKLLFETDEVKKYELIENIVKKEIDLENFFEKYAYWKILVFYEENPKSCYIMNFDKEEKSFSKYGAYTFDLCNLRKRIPNTQGFEKLKDKKVTIIGLGSGGSKDAEYLVKSGIINFVLIDDDILETENIIRHSCSLSDLSLEKVYAVENKLLKINPDAKISTLCKKLDVIDSHANELIKDSDLIIVATAENEELFNEYAYTNGIPAIYSKVYPMGFGGEIIRIIPGITPCFECSHYFKESSIQENRPGAVFPEYGTTSYDTLENGNTVPIPALAVDSDFLSLISVKMALEILLVDNIDELKDSPNIRLWGNSKEWIFDQEFQCISINTKDMKSFTNCIVCHGDKVIEKELGKSNDLIESDYTNILSNIKKTDDAKA